MLMSINIQREYTYTSYNHLGYRRGTQIDIGDRVSLLQQQMQPEHQVVEANLAFDTIYLKIK